MAAECWIMTQNISMSSKVPIKARIHQAIKLLVLQYNARFNSRLACKTGCDASEQSSVVNGANYLCTRLVPDGARRINGLPAGHA
jgi:hypothetical protein